jgi:hypothetical protein
LIFSIFWRRPSDMPLLGFTMFKEEILSGEKRQTIRKLRKIPVRKGDRLHLYWKLRTKQCEKLGEAICTETFFISISYHLYDSGSSIAWIIYRHKTPNSSGRKMPKEEAIDMALRDGFNKDHNANPYGLFFQPVQDMIRALERMHGDLHNQIYQVIRWGRLEKKEA